ncbi:enoyl-CoA hydratase-related protein [Rhodovulum sp. DZ06]|uniref:enoyl-CoA hydratase-related protein n=1 Tax=Rhodovulum sp. DZ06 TaxID=3425126 RepID=UPI003D347784
MHPPRYRTLSCAADDQGVVTIALSRPDARNAIDAQMRSDLAHAFHHAAEYGRAILLTGAGDSFCAGQDMGEGRNLRELDLGRTLREEYTPLLKEMRDVPLPVVAAVNGDAAGAGMHLALHCDVVFAAESALFMEAAGQLGLIPDVGGSWWLPRLVGPARAMGMALFSEPIRAETAESWGLIWRAVPDAELLSRAHARAAQLANGPREGFVAMRHAMREAMESTLGAQLETEARMQAELGRSRDFKEAVLALGENRAPEFEGR